MTEPGQSPLDGQPSPGEAAPKCQHGVKLWSCLPCLKRYAYAGVKAQAVLDRAQAAIAEMMQKNANMARVLLACVDEYSVSPHVGGLRFSVHVLNALDLDDLRFEHDVEFEVVKLTRRPADESAELDDDDDDDEPEAPARLLVVPGDVDDIIP